MNTPDTPRPTRTSTALTVVVGLAIIGAVLQERSVLWWPVGVSFVGVSCLVVCLFLAETRPTGAKSFAVSLLTVPVSLGLVGGVVTATVLLVDDQFPVSTGAEIPLATLRIVGQLGIVTGCTVAVFGLALGYRNVLAAQPLERYTKVAAVTALLPLLVGLFLVVRVSLTGGTRATESAVGAFLGRTVQLLVSPDSTALHLESFLLVVSISGGAISLFLRRVPVAELNGMKLVTFRRVEMLRRLLYVAVAGSALLMVIAGVGNALHSPRQLEARLGSGVFESVRLVTTAGWLRGLLLGLAVLATGWLVLGTVLGQWSARSESTASQWIAPAGVGALLTGGVWLAADAVFERTVEETTRRLPSAVAAEFQAAVEGVVAVYGETAVVVLVVGVGLGLTAWVGSLLWLAVYSGHLSSDEAGFSIASVGLSCTAISASTTAAPSWLIFAGVAAALVVWDLGRFGAQLRREVGEPSTRTVEFVHAGATLLVGLLGVSCALALEAWASTVSVTASPTLTLALVALIVGLATISLALRGSVPFSR